MTSKQMGGVDSGLNHISKASKDLLNQLNSIAEGQPAFHAQDYRFPRGPTSLDLFKSKEIQDSATPLESGMKGALELLDDKFLMGLGAGLIIGYLTQRAIQKLHQQGSVGEWVSKKMVNVQRFLASLFQSGAHLETCEEVIVDIPEDLRPAYMENKAKIDQEATDAVLDIIRGKMRSKVKQEK